MEKKNKIVLIILIALTIVIVAACIITVTRKEDTISEDAVKFQEEYSKLNGLVNESTGIEYKIVSINNTNTVKYASESEIVDLLNEERGVIFFGYNTCAWSRSIVSTLTKVAEEEDETIYYLDISNIRSTFTIDDSNKEIIKTIDGSEGYYKILDLLDNNLEEYILTDADGNMYDTSEKRLQSGTVVAVRDGEVTDFHVGTVSSNESAYDELNDSQKKELETIYKKLIESKNTEKICTKIGC